MSLFYIDLLASALSAAEVCHACVTRKSYRIDCCYPGKVCFSPSSHSYIYVFVFAVPRNNNMSIFVGIRTKRPVPRPRKSARKSWSKRYVALGLLVDGGSARVLTSSRQTSQALAHSREHGSLGLGSVSEVSLIFHARSYCCCM